MNEITPKPEKMKRITAYLVAAEYIKFRMVLMQKGTDFSKWLRAKIKEELSSQ